MKSVAYSLVGFIVLDFETKHPRNNTKRYPAKASCHDNTKLINVWSWQYFTPMEDLLLSNIEIEPGEYITHSEYRFGNCSKFITGKSKLVFYAHTFLNHLDVLGKLIIRGWIDIQRIPTCIVLRGVSWSEDQLQSTSYEFQMCVPRITYCHQHQRFKYYYYEWYLPYSYIGGMNWHLNFYGPESRFI